MSIRLGVVMDPIQDINYKKDSTLGMLLAAKARGWSLIYMEQQDLYVEDGIAKAVVSDLNRVVHYRFKRVISRSDNIVLMSVWFETHMSVKSKNDTDNQNDRSFNTNNSHGRSRNIMNSAYMTH